MNTKLTLKLSKKTIDRAKKYARKRRKSLSLLVEEYFNMISDRDRTDDIEISPNVLELSGIIKTDKEIDIKTEYKKHLDEKFGRL